jgi:hypothetical protein
MWVELNPKRGESPPDAINRSSLPEPHPSNSEAANFISMWYSPPFG